MDKSYYSYDRVSNRYKSAAFQYPLSYVSRNRDTKICAGKECLLCLRLGLATIYVWHPTPTSFSGVGRTSYTCDSRSEVDVERLFCGDRDLLGIPPAYMSGNLMRILTLLKACFERQIAQNKAKGDVLLPDVKVFLFV
jgi:hypothetical protein